MSVQKLANEASDGLWQMGVVRMIFMAMAVALVAPHGTCGSKYEPDGI